MEIQLDQSALVGLCIPQDQPASILTLCSVCLNKLPWLMRNVCERKEGREETVENCHKVGLPMQPKVVASQHAPQRAICTCPDPLRHSQHAGVEEETQTQQGRQ